MQQQIDLLNQESRKVTNKLEEDLKAAQDQLKQLSLGTPGGRQETGSFRRPKI